MALPTPFSVALARYKAEIAWEQNPGGIFVLGTSLLGGADLLAASVFSETFTGEHDDVTADLSNEGIDIIRGRTDDLALMAAGAATLRLQDAEGKYNRKNASSPLFGLLNPLRAVRISAVLDYRTAVLSDAPCAYWRLSEDAAATEAVDYAARAFPLAHGAGVVRGAPGLLAGEASFAAQYGGAADGVSTVSSPALLADVFEGTVPWSVEAIVSTVGLDSNDRVIFSAHDGSASGVTISATATRIRVSRKNAGGQENCDYTYTIVGTSSPTRIVATYDGTTIRLFVNGTISASIASSRSLPDLTAIAVGNSASSPSTTAGWKGTIDEVSVYEREIADDTILAHYDAAAGTRFNLYYGFTRRIEQTPRGRSGEATITCVDLFIRLERVKPVIASTGPTTVGSAFGLLLNAAEWTDSTLRQLSIGDEIADFSAGGTENVLQIGSKLLDIDRGAFFIGAGGASVYADRNYRLTMPTKATISNVMRAIASGADLDEIVNRQRATKTGGVEQVASDATSIAAYGEAEGDAIDSPWLLSDTKAEGLAQFIVYMRKEPGSDLWTLELKNRDSSTLRQMLVRELVDRVSVSEAVTGDLGDYHIEQVSHKIQRGGRYHNCSWRLAERTQSEPFILGSSQLGSTDILGF